MAHDSCFLFLPHDHDLGASVHDADRRFFLDAAANFAVLAQQLNSLFLAM
jgi:hypothetical protein